MNWLSMKERMPEKGVDVQVYCDDTREQFVAFSLGDGRFQFAQAQDGTAIVCRPSHWKELDSYPGKQLQTKYWNVTLASDYYVLGVKFDWIPGNSVEMAKSYAISMMANPNVWRVSDIEIM